MTYGRSLERHLKRFDLPLTFTEWASLAQDRAGWHKRVTHPPFEIGKPFTRQPRGDTRVTPEEKRRCMCGCITVPPFGVDVPRYIVGRR